MSGVRKTIADRIAKRGTLPLEIPRSCYFLVIFKDGSSVSEKKVDWSSFSKHKTVKYFGMQKEVLVSKYPISYIKVYHEGLETAFFVPESAEVYTAFRSQRVITAGGRYDKLLGRCVGLVRDGEVMEERFLNGIEQEVMGMKL